jgi:hypothetical protein
MKIPATSLLPLALLVAPTFAGIDSGGGQSSGGTTVNHGSIGESFATVTTLGCPTRNHPGLIEVLYPVAPPLLTDADGNGFPDAWEMQHFGQNGVDPDGDADHDGSSNRMEYLAGTDPTDPTCVFRPQGSYANGIFRMPLQTITGRSYQIWVTRDLKTWTLHATLTGDGNQQVFQFDETSVPPGPLHSDTHPSRYFFRIQILMP